MITIGWFSTGEFSADNTAGAVGPFVRWLLPGATEAQVAALHALTRKTAHFGEYAVLASLWFVALTREQGLTPRRAAWVSFLVSVGAACFDELHQAFVPTRTASLIDVALDSTAALTAAAIGGHGGGRLLEVAAIVMLWTVAAAGALVVAVDVAGGMSSGLLWVTVPAATLSLALRR